VPIHVSNYDVSGLCSVFLLSANLYKWAGLSVKNDLLFLINS